VTVKVLPAIVRVPVRVPDVVLLDTANATEPLPVPLEPEVMEIQIALLDAVQAHPEGAVTATVPLPAVDPKLCDPGEIVSEHVPACVTVMLLPAI
jgi:hypothetical protein